MMKSRMSLMQSLSSMLLVLLIPLAVGCKADSVPEAMEEDTHSGSHLDVATLSPKAIETAGIQISASRRMTFQTYLETTGSVTPNESRIAHIRPLSRGVIEKVYVRRGDRVLEGEPLIQYDNIELGEQIGEYLSQKAQLRQAQTQMGVTRKFWERGKQLLEAQAIAEKEVELRQAEYSNAEAMVSKEEAELAKIEEKLHRYGLSDADIDELAGQGHAGGHRTSSHNTLIAPFSGVIIDYDVAEGELVGPERELLTLADVSTVWVLADVYEKDLSRVGKGLAVEVSTVAYPDRIFSGKITYISDLLEKDTRTARVRCVVANRDGALKLEMFTSVRIPAKEQRSVIAVPSSAIQNIDGKDVVFLTEDGETFRKKEVATGQSVAGWTEVEGIQPDVQLVSEGSFYLKSVLKRESIGEEH